jgi:hypothetical protein
MAIDNSKKEKTFNLQPTRVMARRVIQAKPEKPIIPIKRVKKVIQFIEDPNNPYERIINQTNNDDANIKCDVCLEFEYDSDDEIVLCELCNNATH